jgi:hypothetical protein
MTRSGHAYSEFGHRRKGQTVDLPKRGWRLGGVGTFGVVACVQEVAVTPGELLADADLIRYTMGAPWT